MENKEETSKKNDKSIIEKIGAWIGKEVAGTALVTAIGGALGAAYGAIKKAGVKSKAIGGAGLGFVVSLGLGGMVYDGLASAFGGGDKAKTPEQTASSDKNSEKNVNTEVASKASGSDFKRDQQVPTDKNSGTYAQRIKNEREQANQNISRA
ncbi:MAG: hypothetical protein R3D71_04135 [Rickettsiales bacterium]